MMLVGCGKKETTTAVATPPAATAAPAPAAPAKTATPAATAAAPAAKSEGRAIEITGNDQMQFSIKTMDVKVGEEIKVIMTNVGTLPKEAMGHNWVLLQLGTDVNAFATAAMTAKATDYIPPAMKDKVVAFIPVLGPKQKGEVSFKVPAAGEYTYICSFPGHYMIMKGTLTAK